MEALKAGQTDIQKNIQASKDLLAGKQAPPQDVFVTIKGAPAIGPETAKVTIVEFSDYQCPFCARYATQTMGELVTEYVKTGKVRYIFRNFPLEQIHPHAAKAAEAAQCAMDQGKFWDMHDHLFKNQTSLDPKALLSHASTVGLDGSKFQECMDTGKYTAMVKNDIVEGQKFGVRGTPTFFFGTEITKDSKLKVAKMTSGASPVANFKQIIDELLAAAQADKGKEKKSD